MIESCTKFTVKNHLIDPYLLHDTDSNYSASSDTYIY